MIKIKQSKEYLLGYLFILPALIFFIAFVFYPTINSFILSLFDWDLLSDRVFVGFENYRHIFEDDRIAKIALNTVMLATMSIMLKLGLGTLLAYMVFKIKNKITKFILEFVIFLPVVLPMSVISMVFLMLFNTDIGAINGILFQIGLPKIAWLTSGFLPLVSVLIIDVWKGVGFFFIVSLVAIREVPQNLLEAAELDGANEFRKFVSIIVPVIRATTMFLVINAIITSLQIFDPVYMLMRDGGPGDAATTISYYIWNTGLYNRDTGYGSALAVVLFVVIMTITIIEIKIRERRMADV